MLRHTTPRLLSSLVITLVASVACTNHNDERVPLFDSAIEVALKEQPADHAGVARWAHQYMMGREAWAILKERGYRCMPGVCVYEAGPSVGRLEVLIESGGEYPLRHAVGRRMLLGRELQRVEAPGMVFGDAQTFALWIASMISADNKVERSEATSLPVRGPAVVRVHDYYELPRRLARRGFDCRLPNPTTRRCENRSFSGQSQVVLIKYSPEDFSPREMEGQLDGKIARIALEGPPRPVGTYVPPPGRPFF